MTDDPYRRPADGEGWRRRRVLCALAALPAVAGCTGPESSPADGESPGSGDESEAGDDGDESGAGDGATTATPALDLREANVTGVSVAEGSGDYRFDVTLYHDDDGEEGYADWWQVERLDGERLGRRDLAHPHSTDPFTRSATVAVPEDAPCVVVRGHDQTHGYGGRAMVGDVGSGETSAVDQGAEPETFSSEDCP